MATKSFLFQMVHPAKYFFHRETINALISEGHHVDIIVQNKDVLLDLVTKEKWNFYNLFPNGRKIKWLPKKISYVVAFLLSFLVMLSFARKKKYDLFVGGELGTIGKFRDTTSLYVTDDDMVNTPQQHQACFFVDYILAPELCDMKQYNHKKIGYNGFKALCHLHPSYFSPDKNKLDPKLKNKRFFLIRTCSHNSTHDIIGTKGIDNKTLYLITNKLSQYGEIVLAPERKLPEYFSKYYEVKDKESIHHYMYYADIFIGDSVTMGVESALLGTISVEYDSWWYKFDQTEDLVLKYNLLYGIKEGNYLGLLNKLDNILDNFNNLAEISKTNSKKLIDEKDNVTEIQIDLIKKLSGIT